MKASNLNLKIKSQTEKLSLVREFVSEAAREFGFDDESVNKIALAVDEACTNIIKHSYEFASNKDIEIMIVTNNGKFEVVISDQGKGFDPEMVKVPDMREYLSKYKKGGLGMYLMRSLMDKVEYKISRGKKNEVHLVKSLPVKVPR
jgi:serine/threonine-protein kinase RsbW